MPSVRMHHAALRQSELALQACTGASGRMLAEQGSPAPSYAMLNNTSLQTDTLGDAISQQPPFAFGTASAAYQVLRCMPAKLLIFPGVSVSDPKTRDMQSTTLNPASQ